MVDPGGATFSPTRMEPNVDVVVIAWPADPLVAEAHRRVVAAAVAAGHRVTDLDLLAEGFEARMPPEERGAYHDESGDWGPLLTRHVEAVRAAAALVFVYPTMATSLPPVVRGWLERVMLPGVAFVFDERSHRVRPGLTHVRRIVGVATYDESWPVVKLRNDNGRRVILRALRLNTGLRARGRWVACYGATRADERSQAEFLRRAEQAVAW